MLIAHPEKSLPFLLDEKKFPTIVRVWILFWYNMGEKFRGVEPCFDKSLRTDYFLLWKNRRRLFFRVQFLIHRSNDRDSVVVSIIFHRVVRFLDALSCIRVQLYGVLL